MAKIKKQQEEVVEVRMRVYTPEELKKFGELIEKFKEEKTLSTGEVVKIYNYNRIMVAYGAAKEYVRTYTRDNGETYEVKTYNVWPPRYIEFENLWRQFNGRQGAIEYAKKKSDYEFEKMAGSHEELVGEIF